ncbi:MAG: DUF2750 domain-containing protein [Pirellulales bacterium]|nr:DUF2750 domain-containing protein [Pirellulales bacterium]
MTNPPSGARTEQDAQQLADEFVKTVVAQGEAFVFQSGTDYPIFPMHGAEVMPFWSSRELARQVQQHHAEYADFKVARVDFDQFFHTMLPEMADQGVLIGLNWSGQELLGFDQSAEDLIDALAAEMSL